MFLLSFLSPLQVDEMSVFRHKGERKVKTVEEDMEDEKSRTAELLEDGEELVGGRTQEDTRAWTSSALLLITVLEYDTISCCFAR